ncbi:MAG: hypothetical protein IKK66_05070 [Ruminococcus sp.]|nr:hypothetical protein [Ruminococcus sp.]
MKNIFVKSALALMAAFALTGCTVSEYQYDSTGTGTEATYSINIVDKSEVTDAPEVQATKAPAAEETAAPVVEATEAPAIEETEAATDMLVVDITEPFAEEFIESTYPDSYVEYYFRSQSQLDQHFSKHGYEFDGDFNYETAEDYENGASDVINNPNALYKTEAEDGDHVYYIEATNEFVVLSTDGYIRTYFRPNAGIDYFNRQ